MKKRSLESNIEMSVVGSSNSVFDDHDQTPQAQTSFLHAGLSSAKSTHKEGVHSKKDVYTIVIKPGLEVDLAKRPGPEFHESTRINSGQPGKIKKNIYNISYETKHVNIGYTYCKQ